MIRPLRKVHDAETPARCHTKVMKLLMETSTDPVKASLKEGVWAAKGLTIRPAVLAPRHDTCVSTFYFPPFNPSLSASRSLSLLPPAHPTSSFLLSFIP